MAFCPTVVIVIGKVLPFYPFGTGVRASLADGGT
jgi:hypothetical protein